MKKLEEIYKSTQSDLEFSQQYVGSLIELLGSLDHKAIVRIIQTLDEARAAKRRIYFAGNGGSASTCGHFCNDLGAGAKRHGGGEFRVIDLTSNMAAVTALANDCGYENVFLGQIEGVIGPKDVLVVISASGNSPNLVKAVEYAKKQGTKIIGLLGFDGGKLQQLCDIPLVIKTPAGQYGPVEDIHLVMNHLISTYLCLKQAEDPNGRSLFRQNQGSPS